MDRVSWTCSAPIRTALSPLPTPATLHQYLAGKELPLHPLWALSWSAFGTKIATPMLGDVLIFARNGGGHVALYAGEDETAYHTLGGNHSDSVCIRRIAKSRLYAPRRPLYHVQPANVRPVRLASTGALSSNEAGIPLPPSAPGGTGHSQKVNS